MTVVAPGEKPKTFITVAQPKTNIVGDISMIREVNSKAEMDAMTSAKALPATAVYTVNSKLEALDAEGKAFATVAEILAAHDYKILPAFRVADIARTKMCPLARVLRTELRRRGITARDTTRIVVLSCLPHNEQIARKLL